MRTRVRDGDVGRIGREADGGYEMVKTMREVRNNAYEYIDAIRCYTIWCAAMSRVSAMLTTMNRRGVSTLPQSLPTSEGRHHRLRRNSSFFGRSCVDVRCTGFCPPIVALPSA